MQTKKYWIIQYFKTFKEVKNLIMRIQAQREAANLTQAQLALRVGVTQGTVSLWERESILPKSRDLPLLAKVLGCTIDELYEPGAASAECDPA